MNVCLKRRAGLYGPQKRRCWRRSCARNAYSRAGRALFFLSEVNESQLRISGRSSEIGFETGDCCKAAPTRAAASAITTKAISSEAEISSGAIDGIQIRLFAQHHRLKNRSAPSWGSHRNLRARKAIRPAEQNLPARQRNPAVRWYRWLAGRWRSLPPPETHRSAIRSRQSLLQKRQARGRMFRLRNSMNGNPLR